MKFMLLIGGNHEAWNGLSDSMWAESEDTHRRLIADLTTSGEFIECDELRWEPASARVVRSVDGNLHSTPGTHSEDGNFASGYYLVQCRDIERATEIAGQLYESRFVPIEVRQVGR